MKCEDCKHKINTGDAVVYIVGNMLKLVLFGLVSFGLGMAVGMLS